MASFPEQVRAIWNALDEMSANDPNAYQKFIQSQMAEGGKLLQANSTGAANGKGQPRSTGPVSSANSAGSRESRDGLESLDMMKLLGQMFNPTATGFSGLAKQSPTATNSTKLTTSSTSIMNSKKGKDHGTAPAPASIINGQEKDVKPKEKPNPNSLTDDNFKMTSMLASIVTLDEEGDPEDSFHLDELKLPGAVVVAAAPASEKEGDKEKKKPLIEEL